MTRQRAMTAPSRNRNVSVGRSVDVNGNEGRVARKSRHDLALLQECRLLFVLLGRFLRVRKVRAG